MSPLGEQPHIRARAAAELEHAGAGVEHPGIEQFFKHGNAPTQAGCRPARDEMIRPVPGGELLEPSLPLALEARHGVSMYCRCHSSRTIRAQSCGAWLRAPR